MREQSLRCEGLSKSFDGVRALTNVTLEFPASGSVAIIGPNGAGKTTLLNILTGILRPDCGGAWLGDHSLLGKQAHEIARLGVARTFQELRFVGHLSVLENVMLARPNQSGERLLYALLRVGTAREEETNKTEALKQLQFVGLADAATELAGELSYGQQKLLTLACCVATNANILLLDEPVAGVHPEMIGRILGVLRRLRDSGTQILFIEHDIASVRQFADVVVVMDQGRVIAHGKPSEVLEKREIMEAYVG
jgi:ABC-type branched-subunit amino acid transport system ATPase component